MSLNVFPIPATPRIINAVSDHIRSINSRIVLSPIWNHFGVNYNCYYKLPAHN